MKAVGNIIFSPVLLGLVSACAYDPAYNNNSYDSYYGGRGFRNPNYGHSSYGFGYSNGHYNSGYPQSGYYNRGYDDGRYCPDDDSGGKRLNNNQFKSMA